VSSAPGRQRPRRRRPCTHPYRDPRAARGGACLRSSGRAPRGLGSRVEDPGEHELKGLPGRRRSTASLRHGLTTASGGASATTGMISSRSRHVSAVRIALDVSPQLVLWRSLDVKNLDGERDFEGTGGPQDDKFPAPECPLPGLRPVSAHVITLFLTSGLGVVRRLAPIADAQRTRQGIESAES
jgi:hypothetical protein